MENYAVEVNDFEEVANSEEKEALRSAEKEKK